jgi:hypothetical protein
MAGITIRQMAIRLKRTETFFIVHIPCGIRYSYDHIAGMDRFPTGHVFICVTDTSAQEIPVDVMRDSAEVIETDDSILSDCRKPHPTICCNIVDLCHCDKEVPVLSPCIRIRTIRTHQTTSPCFISFCPFPPTFHYRSCTRGG